MRLSICPTATIHAPPDVVWRLLTDPAEYAHWAGEVVAVDPVGPMRAGQRIVLRERTLRRDVQVTLQVRDIRETPHRTLRVDVALPFGVVIREVITCAALGADASFVSFN